MAAVQPKKPQDPTKDLFLAFLGRELKREENKTQQVNINAMMKKAMESGPPKPKTTWLARDGKVWMVPNNKFQAEMKKYPKQQWGQIYRTGAPNFQSAHTPPENNSAGTQGSSKPVAKPIDPPTAAQMAQTAEYKQKLYGNELGMHLIYAKLRVGAGQGDDEGVDLDICNDTGSTVQTVPNSLWVKFLKPHYTGATKKTTISTPGNSFEAILYTLEVRLYKDMERSKPLTDWFETESIVRPDGQKQLSGSEIRDQAMFATPIGNSKLIMGTSKIGVAWRILMA